MRQFFLTSTWLMLVALLAHLGLGKMLTWLAELKNRASREN